MAKKIEKIETAYGTLPKQELIKRSVALSPAKISIEQTKIFFDAICSAIRESIKNGDSVVLPEVGTLLALDRPKRTGRNPATGETVDVDPNMHLKFKVSPKMKADLKAIDPTKRKPKKFY